MKLAIQFAAHLFNLQVNGRRFYIFILLHTILIYFIRSPITALNIMYGRPPFRQHRSPKPLRLPRSHLQIISYSYTP